MGLFITQFIHCYHHDQFRPKSGSGDQNKQIVPLVETVGWTATEVIAFDMTLEQCFSCGTLHRTILVVMTSIFRVHLVMAQPVISSINPAQGLLGNCLFLAVVGRITRS